MGRLLKTVALLGLASGISACNAGVIALGYLAEHTLSATTASGSVANAPSNVRVGYLAWIEILGDGAVQGKLNFDLIKEKNISFDKVAKPENQRFTLELSPKASVVEGTYVGISWDDVNSNGVYEGDQGEKRAPEVYRGRGQAGTRSLWTAEKFVFSDNKLSLEYASQDGGIQFTF